MISPKVFYDKLVEKGVNFFTGVPDSSLKHFGAYVTDNADANNHIIAANEGNAVGIAAGHYFGSGNPALVYMQNSGQGNAVNPLTSLADPEVYSIPMILLIGWRGEPGKKDEPQHVKQGKITLLLLETLDIPYSVLTEDMDDAVRSLENAVNIARSENRPYALVAKKGIFEPYKLQDTTDSDYELSREDAIKLVVDSLDEDSVIVSTTGKTSRELFEYREEQNQGHSKDFLTVGSMGHTSSIALGLANTQRHRQVYILDGDGAAIMHTGSLAIIGQHKQNNIKHIILNNGAHDSVGGQPTVGFHIDFPQIAKSSGYKLVHKAETITEVKEKLKLLKSIDGPALLEIRVKKGARKNLGRPTKTPIQNKEAFMNNLKQ